MSMIDDALMSQLQGIDKKLNLTPNDPQISVYNPSDDKRKMRQIILDAFRWADVIKRKPRREFNDLSELSRMMVDQMSFNIYQPNNGQAAEGNPSESWKSHAMRPIVRNKVMSVTAHITAKLLFPKVFAYNQQSETQLNAATAMRDLIEWASEQNNYARMTLYAAINACVNPYAVMHTEYCESYRKVKREKGEDGKWVVEEELDEDYSGFKLTPVPCDEFYYGDFYEEDVQRQPYVIWRRVQTYEAMKAKYGAKENFKYVKPGIQVVYNDANVSFYEVYDANLRQSLCEEVIFYSKALDLKIALVNGIMIDDYDNPNPRIDKNYPFIVFGYENFDEGKSICKKSLVFKMQPDADIINTLYPMIIDGTYLNLMPPLIITGEQKVAADVVIPGVTTALTNAEATVTPLRVAQDIKTGMETLLKLEESITESTIAQLPTGKITAYQLSRIEQEQAIQLTPFVAMLGSYVRQYGKLLMGDIIQYMTLPEVDKIIDNGELVYKTFIVRDRQSEGSLKSRRINFDMSTKTDMTDQEELDESYSILDDQGGIETKEEIYKIHPALFRELKYYCYCSPDTITPMSDDLEKSFGLELFDRAIQAPKLGVPVDMEQVFKDFLFGLYPKAKDDVNKYFIKEQPGQLPQGILPPGVQMNPQGQPMQGQPMQPGQQPQQQNPMAMAGRPTSPMNAMANNPLSGARQP